MIVVLAAFVALSCSDTGRPVEPSIPLDYVQGRVFVELADTVRYSFARSFFEGLGLEPVYMAADLPFAMLIRVDSVNLDQRISELIRDSAVTTVMKWPSSGSDPQKLRFFVTFAGTVRPPYALALIDSIPGLSWERSAIEPQGARATTCGGWPGTFMDREAHTIPIHHFGQARIRGNNMTFVPPNQRLHLTPRVG
jgi:hypothetical protein